MELQRIKMIHLFQKKCSDQVLFNQFELAVLRNRALDNLEYVVRENDKRRRVEMSIIK